MQEEEPDKSKESKESKDETEFKKCRSGALTEVLGLYQCHDGWLRGGRGC